MSVSLRLGGQGCPQGHRRQVNRTDHTGWGMVGEEAVPLRRRRTLTTTAVLSPDPPPAARPNLFGEAFADLLGAARADAGWAYERLYRGFGPAVLGYARAQGAGDPDDLANDVLLRAFTNLHTFSGDEPAFRSWLFTIAHHAVVDDRRRRARRPVVADAEVPDEALPAAEQVAAERLATDEVRALLDVLAPDQRDVLVLRLLGDQTIEQIAHTLGKRPGAVKALQRRGLATLRRHLDVDVDGGPRSRPANAPQAATRTPPASQRR